VGGVCEAEDGQGRSSLRDFLEKGMATLSSILAWRIPWTLESPQRSGWATDLGVAKSQTQLSE